MIDAAAVLRAFLATHTVPAAGSWTQAWTRGTSPGPAPYVSADHRVAADILVIPHGQPALALVDEWTHALVTHGVRAHIKGFLALPRAVAYRVLALDPQVLFNTQPRAWGWDSITLPPPYADEVGAWSAHRKEDLRAQHALG